MKPKLYIYPAAKDHVHDHDPPYEDTVPLSKKGIQECFEVVDEEKDADYLYMGQIDNATHRWSHYDFPFLEERPEDHICDLQGEGGVGIPFGLRNSIVTTMGPTRSEVESNPKIFPRPTFSHLFMDIVRGNRDPYQAFYFPDRVSFGFKGYVNNKTRVDMMNALNGINMFSKDITATSQWHGPSKNGSSVQEEYVTVLKDNAVSFCPRGEGIDSVRFYETCYFNRVPVIIADQDFVLLGEDRFDMSFVYRVIEPELTQERMFDVMCTLHSEGVQGLQDRANQAKRYFDEVVIPYFASPTKFFLEWLK